MNTNAEDRDINQKLHEARNLCWHELKYVNAERLAAGVMCQVCKHCQNYYDENPAYDSSLTDAFNLVEWMRKEKGFEFRCQSVGGRWYAYFEHGVVDSFYDKSLPRAIALAAIRALEVK